MEKRKKKKRSLLDVFDHMSRALLAEISIFIP